MTPSNATFMDATTVLKLPSFISDALHAASARYPARLSKPLAQPCRTRSRAAPEGSSACLRVTLVDPACSSNVTVTSLSLPLHLLQVIIQPVEAVLPETTVTLHPVGSLLQRPYLEPARPRLRHATARDQTCSLEHLQVLGDARKAHLEGLGQLLDGRLTGSETDQDLTPGRVSKGRKRAVKRFRCHF